MLLKKCGNININDSSIFLSCSAIIIVKIQFEKITIFYVIVLMSVLDLKSQNNDNYYILYNE